MSMRIDRLTDRGNHRWEIQLQNGESFLVEEDVVVKERLVPGKEIPSHLIERLPQLNRLSEAYGKALVYLSFRSRTKEEIRRYLASKGYETEAGEVIDRLEREGAVDDFSFARMWIRERFALNPRGIYALQKELQEKGIDTGLVEKALLEVDDRLQEEAAYKQGLKKMEVLRGRNFAMIREKVSLYLMRKGYPFSLIERVIPRLEEAFKRRETNSLP